MADKLIDGCLTPRDPNLKQAYEALSQMFAPVVYFDPKERFFPVDLPSAVNNSALFRTLKQNEYEEAKVQEPPLVDYGNITPTDMSSAEEGDFLTIVGWTTEEEEPTPKIDEIYNMYSSGAIPAKLTTYATVCEPMKVPNYNMFMYTPPKPNVVAALGEGVLLNYYFYFPALESPKTKREGDWSGISILFKDKSQINNLNEINPILTCYFKKIEDIMVADIDSFRLWEKVTRVRDLQSGLNTHPIVYISKGRHNCYYVPVNTTNYEYEKLYYRYPDSTKIEEGSYLPGPGGGEVRGEVDLYYPWWVYVVFPHTLLADVCGELGCPFPKKFDPSGLPPGPYIDEDDSVKKGGYEAAPPNAQTGGTPGNDTYPSGSPTLGGPINLKLNLIYVDLFDTITKANWAYKGYWGAAKVREWEWVEDNGSIEKRIDGIYGGFRRPNLAPWFLWNLYWDPTFGAGGGGGYLKTP